MEYDFDNASQDVIYKLLASTVIPRPIAWVTTRSRAGIENAAPFSFFNIMGTNPPLVALGIQSSQQGGLKDTAKNILDTKIFAINLVSKEMAQEMNGTSFDYDASINELEAQKIAVVPASSMDLSLIKNAPVKMECVLHTEIETGPSQYVILGEVKVFHIDDAFLDKDTGYVDGEKLGLISRMHGRGWYSDNSRFFEMIRPMTDPSIKG